MKNIDKGIWLILVLVSLFGRAFGDPVPVFIHKVKLVMKDGPTISGYVFWNQEITETGPFEAGKFLEHWRSHPNEAHEFELFKELFPIQDQGAMGGLAHLKEDDIQVDSRLVASIVSVPDSYEGHEVTCDFPELTREEIAIMQKKLVGMDSIPYVEEDITAFNYDPGVKKGRLHRLLLQFKQLSLSENGKVKAEKWSRKEKPPMVVIVPTGACD